MGIRLGWLAFALGVLASVACAVHPAGPSAALKKDLAPSGTLHVGVVIPARSRRPSRTPG